jgi:hypothetical protein
MPIRSISGRERERGIVAQRRHRRDEVAVRHLDGELAAVGHERARALAERGLERILQDVERFRACG